VSPPRSTGQPYCVHSWGRDRDPPVLLLHGFTGHGGSWAEAGGRFAEQGFHVLAPDLLGHGRSPHPSEADRYEMAHAGADLKTLLEESGVAAVHLLGYSMGGRLALFFALNYPERVRTLTLVGASPGIASAVGRAERRERDNGLAVRIEREGIGAFVDYWESLALWNSQRRNLSTAQRRRLREQRLQNRPRGLANSLRGMGTGAQPNLHDALPSVSAPTLLLVGAEDEQFVAVNRRMAQSIPMANLVVIPETGHAVHLERPRDFARTVLDFWRSTESSGTPESQL